MYVCVATDAAAGEKRSAETSLRAQVRRDGGATARDGTHAGVAAAGHGQVPGRCTTMSSSTSFTAPFVYGIIRGLHARFLFPVVLYQSTVLFLYMTILRRYVIRDLI